MRLERETVLSLGVFSPWGSSLLADTEKAPELLNPKRCSGTSRPGHLPSWCGESRALGVVAQSEPPALRRAAALPAAGGGSHWTKLSGGRGGLGPLAHRHSAPTPQLSQKLG